MSRLARLKAWAFPSLPPVQTSALSPHESYAAVADVLPRFELGKAKWPDFDVARYDSEVYRKLALVFRCLSLISHAAGTAKVRVYDEANDDEEIADHPMRKLIRQPNPHTGEARFWGTVALRAGVAGFCVVEKERNRSKIVNPRGDVVALNPLRSDWLKAIPMGRGVYDWEYRIPGKDPARLDYRDVVAFTWADTPNGSPYGLPPLATVVRDAAILDKLTQFVGNLLDTGGVPMWMFPLKAMPGNKLNDEEIQRLEDRWQRRRGGIERRGFPWVTDSFDTPVKLSLDPEEIAMECIRDLSDLAICQAFGVPPRKAGVRVGLEHTTQNATAAVEDGEFYRDTIVPLWTRLDDALTTGLLPDFEPPDSTVSLEFDVSDVDALAEDKAKRIDGFRGGVREGSVTPNELRTELGLKPLPPEVGDVLYVPLYLSPKTLTGEPRPVTSPAPAENPNATPSDATTPPPGQFGAVRIVHIGPGPSSRYEARKAAGAANKRLIANVAEAREPSLRTLLRDQAERIAAHVKAPLGVALARSNGHAPHRYSVAEIDWSYEQEQLESVLRLLYQLAGSTAFDAAADQLGIGLSFDLANPKVRDVLDRLALRVVDITQATRDLIAELVTAGEQAGKSITEIADDIRASTGFSAARANKIARTESMVSYNLAGGVAWRESGVVDRAQLFDNPGHTDPYPCEDGLTCAQRNGLIVPLDDLEKHVFSEHPHGSLAAAPVLIGED